MRRRRDEARDACGNMNLSLSSERCDVWTSVRLGIEEKLIPSVALAEEMITDNR